MSNSGLVSGLSKASGVKLSWVEVSQESLKNSREQKIGEDRSIEALLKAY